MAKRSSTADLSHALAQLKAKFPNANLIPREALDILWLAERIGIEPKRELDAPPTPSDFAPFSGEVETFVSRPHEEPTQEEQPAQTSAPTPSTKKKVRRAEAKIFARAGYAAGEAMLPARPLNVPGTAALPNTRMIARALRPLMKRVPARAATVLDEVATADRSAEQRFYEPVMRPATVRWLDLALVVERAGSMRFWSRSVDELRNVLERHSAFRSVRAWNLVEEESGLLWLRTWSSSSRRA